MASDKMMYVHPAPVRVWHWINAVGFIILVLTGIQIRMNIHHFIVCHNSVP